MSGGIMLTPHQTFAETNEIPGNNEVISQHLQNALNPCDNQENQENQLNQKQQFDVQSDPNNEAVAENFQHNNIPDIQNHSEIGQISNNQHELPEEGQNQSEVQQNQINTENTTADTLANQILPQTLETNQENDQNQPAEQPQNQELDANENNETAEVNQNVVSPPQIPGNEDVGKENIEINDQSNFESQQHEETNNQQQNQEEASPISNIISDSLSTDKQTQHEPKPIDVNQFFPTQSQSQEDTETQPIYEPPSPSNQQFNGTATSGGRISSPRRPFKRGPEPQEVDQSKVEPLSKKFIAGEQVKETDPIILAAVIVDLEEQRNEMMANGSARESIKIQKALDRARVEQRKAAMNQAQQEKTKAIDEKINFTKEKIQEATQEAKEKEKKQEDDFKRQIDELKKKQEDELADFDNSWLSQSKSRRFTRASQKLRMMKVQQTLLMNAKRFDEADQMTKAINEQQQLEINENSRSMQLEYYGSRNQLIARQQSDIQLLKETQAQQRELLVSANQNKINILMKRQKILEDERIFAQDPEKVWQTSHRNDPDPTLLVTRPNKGTGRAMKKSTAPGDYALLPLPPLKPPPSPRTKKE